MLSAANVTRVRALHPHWIGSLSLSTFDDAVHHDGLRSQGRYDLSDSRLTVRWDEYPAETFQRVGSVFVAEALLATVPDLRRLLAVSLDGTLLELESVSLSPPQADFPVALRLGSSDVETFVQTFLNREYASTHLPADARVIVDLGANIGLSAVFFGTIYPEARILTVEPDPANYSLLIKNVSSLGSRVTCVRGAAWSTDGTLDLQLEDDQGLPLGAWGTRVTNRTTSSPNTTRCFNIGTLAELFNLEEIDVLKVDIEGAELEVFSEHTEGWLERVHMVIVETHDRFRPGSERAVREALEGSFKELPRVGENLFFGRDDGLGRRFGW